MSLDKISNYQKEFDEKYFKKWREGTNKLEFMQNMVVALIGEVGEFANVLKKSVRSNKMLGKDIGKKTVNEMREELTDCFIYIVILSNLLDMDLEEEYFKKMKFNEKRFEKYRGRK